MLTTERRSELNRAIQAKAIRVAIFDVAILGAALFASVRLAEMEPNYQWLPFGVAIGMCLILGIARIGDWKGMTFLEQRLDRDDDESESVF